MTDVFDKEKRSQIMASVKSKNSKAELAVRSMLHKMGFRFRIHVKNLPGVPDIVLPKHKTIIFVHGCFWHRHDCKKATMPSSNKEYWQNKFSRNIDRFKDVKLELISQGWRVFVVWECESENKSFLKLKLNEIFPQEINA